MSQQNQRRQIAAKGKPVTIDSKGESFAFDFVTTATTGTFSAAATAQGGLKVEINGTAYKIPYFTA